MSGSRLHRHRGAAEPHPVTLRHTEDSEASTCHFTDINLWRARRGRRRKLMLIRGFTEAQTREALSPDPDRGNAREAHE